MIAPSMTRLSAARELTLQVDVDELAFFADDVPHDGTAHYRMDSLEVSRAYEGVERAIAAALGGGRSQLSGLRWHFGCERRNGDCSDHNRARHPRA